MEIRDHLIYVHCKKHKFSTAFNKLIPDVYGWLSQQLGEFSLKQLLPQHDLQMLN